MTNAASATSAAKPRTLRVSIHKRARGFTLIELLVVIGIIVVLAGLLLPMILRALRTADRTRTAADLNTIAAALEAYKADFGDYPRRGPDTVTVYGTSGVNTAGTGFAVLANALLGPGDQQPVFPIPSTPNNQAPVFATSANFGEVVQLKIGTGTVEMASIISGSNATAPSATATTWGVVPWSDGADGNGFRVRPGGSGRIWGPYVKADDFKTIYSTGKRASALLDRNETPILYFPAMKPSPNITILTGGASYVGDSTVGEHALYNVADNYAAINGTNATAKAIMRIMIGDYGEDGAINTQSGLPAETAATTAPYILWSAGVDKSFGIDTTTGPNYTSAAPFTSGTPTATQFNENKKAAAASDDVLYPSFIR